MELEIKSQMQSAKQELLYLQNEIMGKVQREFRDSAETQSKLKLLSDKFDSFEQVLSQQQIDISAQVGMQKDEIRKVKHD